MQKFIKFFCRWSHSTFLILLATISVAHPMMSSKELDKKLKGDTYFLIPPKIDSLYGDDRSKCVRCAVTLQPDGEKIAVSMKGTEGVLDVASRNWTNDILGYVPVRDLLEVMRSCRSIFLFVLYHMRNVREFDLFSMNAHNIKCFDNDEKEMQKVFEQEPCWEKSWITRAQLIGVFRMIKKVTGEKTAVGYLPRFCIFSLNNRGINQLKETGFLKTVGKKVFEIRDAEGMIVGDGSKFDLCVFPNIKKFAIMRLSTPILLSDKNKLKIFELDAIPLPELDITQMRSLEKIQLKSFGKYSWGRFALLMDERMPRLSNIKLRGCNLSKVQFKHLTNLKGLHLGWCDSLKIKDDLPNIIELVIWRTD